jgi:hypothetical protein
MTNGEIASSERLFRRIAAASYLAETYGITISAKTLAKWACVTSDGPGFRMFGRTPLYPRSSLDEWAQNRLGPVVRSTSEDHRRAKISSDNSPV